MTAREIRIPDIGDAEDVEVVEICVAVGDSIERDAPLIVIESDKASMEVPATTAGRVGRIDVKVGDRVTQDQLIALIEETDAAEAVARITPPAAPKDAAEGSVERTSEAAPSAAPPRAPRSGAARRLEVRLPDVGDAKDITVVEVAVSAGTDVHKDDLLLVVESDKASMEVPAPAAGRVVEVAVAPGSEVAEGTLLVVIESSDAGAGIEATRETSSVPPPTPSVRGASQPPPAPAPIGAPPAPAATEAAATASARIYAGPAVRRMARELGVDLARVKGTGARARIVKEDVQAYVKARLAAPPETPSPSAGIPAIPAIDFAKFGPVETVALSRIRRRGAANLHRAWLNVPHVTQHDEADVTGLEAFRASLKGEATARGTKLTPLPFVLRALVSVLRDYPTFNASLDPSAEHLILKRYVHIGFAVDTPDGLVVPVIRDVDRKGIWDLAGEIESLSAKARDGKLAPGDLSGGSFSVSSLGAIGGTGFTPIVNAPEVAILGVSRLATKPHWNGTAFEPRQFLPLSLSYDHRAINGAEAGRFVTALCATLSDLRRSLL